MHSNKYEVRPEYVPTPPPVKNDVGCLYFGVEAILFGFLFYFIKVNYNVYAIVVIGLLMCITILWMLDSTGRDASINKAILDSVENKKSQEKLRAETCTNKLNSLLEKSAEITKQILPFYESNAEHYIELAKRDFADSAYSPFWSNIEKATSFFALYKEAMEQLSLNGEIYKSMLKIVSHNFPKEFPYSYIPDVSESLNDYNRYIRAAHRHPTFSIIWEQRRNTQVLVSGFKTLENAVINLTDHVSFAIESLESSLSSHLGNLIYLNESQMENFEASQITLNNTLNSMDTKLYYIHYKQKPLGDFRHR